MGDLLESLAALLDGETDMLANAANVAALLFERISAINWVGFYFLREAAGGQTLVLGPFQGKVACTRIKLGQGVCGTAALRRETLIVPDVQAFAGHIACDASSRSEIVVPLIREGVLVGVLDIDSPCSNRFSEADARCFEQVAAMLMRESWS
ncbi:GAF domain-containing protein [Lichenicoccus sp.]|uniref:GAF domain-containing protein n=1 Tax=Lichenicoccus sp. TaxID=2781899 RepID=UPI003D123B0D